MNILIDECLDRRMVSIFPGHRAKTVPQMGWAAIKNGALLTLAQEKFDVFITVDRHLPSQQHLIKFNIAVLVVRTPTNRFADLKPLIPLILDALPKVKKRHATFVGV